MAKGNLILGTGHGSIGDVTMMRRNGAEVARVRLRKIKNPKSKGQAEQRMYMAPILKFYSPLSKVLETSFEGLNKADSYAKFISINSNLARAEKYAVKKGTGFVPLPYQIAQGSLESPVVGSTGTLSIDAAEAPTTLGTLSTAIIGKYPTLQNGDQVTYIYCKQDGNDIWQVGYGRFILNTASTDGLPAHIYSVRNEPESITCGIADSGDPAQAQAFIFSRWDGEKWARSTSFMVMDPDYMTAYDGTDTEIFDAAVASYMKSGGSTPISDVYLNGATE